MSRPLDGKVALVVGASQGVGRAYALGLAEAGATVVATARKLHPKAEGGASLAEVAGAARQGGGSLVVRGCDVRRAAEVDQLVEEVLINHGRIDVLLYNAAWQGAGDVLAEREETWDSAFALNVRAPYACIRAVAPQMIARRSGSIICMSSRAALPIPSTDPAHAGRLVYGATKAALHRMVTYFAEELRPHGIAVNSLSPGNVAAFSGGAQPQAAQFAPPVVYLARQTASTVTGEFLNTADWGKTWVPAGA